MIRASIVYGMKQDTCTFKECFSETIRELMKEDPNVYYLDADLMNSSGTLSLLKEYPNRAINCGIQEANMAGVAAGLSNEGKKPYIHSFGAFASRRCYDQIFMSVGYAHNSVRIIGSDPGVLAMYNGGTHMPFEDIALYRAIPKSTILEPCDLAQFRWALKATKDQPGVSYIRANRKHSIKIYSDSMNFVLGSACLLRDGIDVTLVATGIMVSEALQAAEQLEAEGIQAAVMDLVTIKPLDTEALVQYARKTGCFVTCENAAIEGGVYAGVCEALACEVPVPIEWIGIYERYGEVGTLDYLKKTFALTAKDIAYKAKKAIQRKHGE